MLKLQKAVKGKYEVKSFFSISNSSIQFYLKFKVEKWNKKQRTKTPTTNCTFNKSSLDRIKLVFNFCDLNKNGVISKHGLRAPLSLSIFICPPSKLSFICEDSTDGAITTCVCNMYVYVWRTWTYILIYYVTAIYILTAIYICNCYLHINILCNC